MVCVGSTGAFWPVVAGRPVADVAAATAGHRDPDIGERPVSNVLNRCGENAGGGQAGAAEDQPGCEGGSDLQLYEARGVSPDTGYRG